MLNSRVRFDVKDVIRSMGVLVGALALTPFSEAQVPPPPWEQTPGSDPYYWREYNFVNPDNFTQESGGGQRDRPVRPIIFDIQRPPGTNSPDGTRPRATREGEPNNIPSQRFGITEGADGDDPVDVQWWVILQIPDQADTNLSKVLWFAYDFRGSGGELTASGGPGMFPNNASAPTYPADRQSANHAEGYIEFASKPSAEWLRLDFYVPAGGSNHFTIDNLQVGTVCVPEPSSAIPLLMGIVGSLSCRRRLRSVIKAGATRAMTLSIALMLVAGMASAQPPPPWERTPDNDPYYWREYSFTNPDNHTQESGGGQRDRPVQPIIWTIAPKPGTNPPESTRPRGTRQGEQNNVPSQRFGIPAGDPNVEVDWQLILQIPDRPDPSLHKILWFSFDFANSGEAGFFALDVPTAGAGQYPNGGVGHPSLPDNRNRFRFDGDGNRVGGHYEGFWELQPKPETEWILINFNLPAGAHNFVTIDNLKIGAISIVPEPTTIVGLCFGLAGLVRRRGR